MLTDTVMPACCGIWSATTCEQSADQKCRTSRAAFTAHRLSQHAVGLSCLRRLRQAASSL